MLNPSNAAPRVDRLNASDEKAVLELQVAAAQAEIARLKDQLYTIQNPVGSLAPPPPSLVDIRLPPCLVYLLFSCDTDTCSNSVSAYLGSPIW